MTLEAYKELFWLWIKNRTLRWILSLVTISVGLGLVVDYCVSGLLLIVLGIITLPEILNKIDYFFNHQITLKLKAVVYTSFLTLSVVIYGVKSYLSKPEKIKVASFWQLKNLISVDNEFIPINNPEDSSVIQVKNYILQNLKEDEQYQSLYWSKIFVMGDKCWVSHKFRITDKNLKKVFYRNYWMNNLGEIQNVEDIE